MIRYHLPMLVDSRTPFFDTRAFAFAALLTAAGTILAAITFVVQPATFPAALAAITALVILVAQALAFLTGATFAAVAVDCITAIARLVSRTDGQRYVGVTPTKE
jgi:hypothetical protein